ncbi:MAG: alpha/beta hydrolase [Alphaproteobacteria bacterium]|nr:alpha/beta hydrolase [Alphaproteobacteria bacterium]
MAILSLLAIATAHAEDHREVVDLVPRPGVTMRLLLLKPPVPVASVLLFTGGDGRVGIGEDVSVRFGGNFLIRTREFWAREQLLTVVVDAPSDYQTTQGLGSYRLYAEHARDIAAAITFVRSRAPVPVWLVGTSRGTLSVANAGARLGAEGADGIVLTSSILRGFKNRGTFVADDVFDSDLAAIRRPVLIAHHREDGCPSTQFADVAALQNRLVNAPAVGLLTYEGGLQPIGSPCEARAQHGYYGLEGRVVRDIAAWITGRRR